MWAGATTGSPDGPAAFVDGAYGWTTFRAAATGSAFGAANGGSWSNAGSWSPAGVPTSSDVVQIPSGVTMTYDMQSGGADCIGVHGTFTVSRSAWFIEFPKPSIR